MATHRTQRFATHPTHSVRHDRELNRPFCLLCGGVGSELSEECTDQDPLDVRNTDTEYTALEEAQYYEEYCNYD